jgi:hypothetical protein
MIAADASTGQLPRLRLRHMYAEDPTDALLFQVDIFSSGGVSILFNYYCPVEREFVRAAGYSVCFKARCADLFVFVQL